MPSKKYFLTLGSSFLLGAAVLIISLIATFLLLPYLAPLFMGFFPFLVGALLVTVIFIVVFIIVYFCAFLGVLIQYIFKPMEVSKEAKGYSISKVKEAGVREKGKTKKRKKK